MGLKRWLTAHRHAPGIVAALGLVERLYAAGSARGRDTRPAHAGGRPLRLLPLPRPRPYGSAERRELARAVREQSTSYSDGDTVRRFEAAAAKALGARHAIAVSSGTSALHVALVAARIGPGDEVLVPALTHAATALAVLHVGAVPRFVDAEPHTWNLDPSALDSARTSRTRAVLPVHLCGIPCAMDSVLAFAQQHGLVVIEDAAQAHGASWRGRPIGTLGALGCFSFQSSKALTTGEGGVVLTDDEALARRARLAMNLGERTSDGRPTAALARFDPALGLEYELAGWNHRMGALQAALGIAQLGRLEAVRSAGRANAERLRGALANTGGLEAQACPAGGEPSPAVLFFAVDPDRTRIGRDELATALAAERIDCRKAYAVPLPAHPLFAAAGGVADGWRERWPVAARLCERGLGLRVDPSLGAHEVDSMARAIERIVTWARSR